MPTVCPNCCKECSHTVTHCPHCGYHVAEDILCVRVAVLEKRLEMRGEAWTKIAELKAYIKKLKGDADSLAAAVENQNNYRPDVNLSEYVAAYTETLSALDTYLKTRGD